MSNKKKLGQKKYSDLNKFKQRYDKRIEKFLNQNSETNVVFLNADYGMGKTTFIKKCLKIPENQIYSPWLNKSDDYIEEIYYNVEKINIGKLSSIALFLGVLATIITILGNSIISILMELNKGDTYIVRMENLSLIFSNDTNMWLLFWSLIIILVIVLIFIGDKIFSNPVPLVKFFKKENGKYYEKAIIKKIVDRIDKVLVIEDIDRTDDIEEILIAANKISEYIKERKVQKYILVTGDYIRTIKRINNSKDYNNNSLNLESSGNKGIFLVEKIISLRIDFLTVNERVTSLLKEKNIMNLAPIEIDEIVEFIKNKYLSIRFLERFLESNYRINERYNSLYHLLLKYYKNEKFFNISDNIIKDSVYNIENFPVCMNDIELLLQKEKVIINGITYENLGKKNNRYDSINTVFNGLFFDKNNELIQMFKKFYFNDKYPILKNDYEKRSQADNIAIIGNLYDNRRLKQNLDDYLISFNNREEDTGDNFLLNKRCYFSAVSTSDNYNFYKINKVNIDKAEVIASDSEFIVAYIAAFMRKNKNEISKNYPKITELISNILMNN